jgi:hypothetical protein
MQPFSTIRSTLFGTAATIALLFYCCRHTSMTSLLSLSCSYYLSLDQHSSALLLLLPRCCFTAAGIRLRRHCHYHAAVFYHLINIIRHRCYYRAAVLLLQAYVYDVTAVTIMQLLSIFRSTLFGTAAAAAALLFYCCRHTSATSLPLSCSRFLPFDQHSSALLLLLPRCCFTAAGIRL